MPCRQLLIALDHKVDKYFIDFQHSCLSKSIRILTHLGSGSFCWMLYASLFIFFYNTLTTFLIKILFAEFIMLFLIIILRNLTKRERPIPEFKYKNLMIAWNRYSFPSLHSARMFMLTFIIAKDYHKFMLVILSTAIIISFTRIYIRKHFISDVMVGAAIGIFSGVIAYHSF